MFRLNAFHSPQRALPALPRLRSRWPAVLAVTVAALALTGCALQQPYQAPPMPVAVQWYAPVPHQGSTQALVDWWSGFDDPALAQLVALAEADSPTLARALAQIDTARATVLASGAAAWPAVTGSASATRSNQAVDANNANSSAITRKGGLDASWEIDLFGKVRSSRESAQAQLQARVDDWHDARVSLGAEVADYYVQYRACRLLVSAYRRAAASQEQTVLSTRAAVRAGLSTGADGYLAEASVARAATTAAQQEAACEDLVKSLVAVTGVDETALRAMVARPGAPALPEPSGFQVSSLPADLVRQRPDLAAAERTLAANYAAIGQARADRLPSLTLSGAISASAPHAGSSGTLWSFGPSLSIPLFDAGTRRAAVDTAVAAYALQLATYRSAVRNAVRDVEQALVALNGAALQSEQAARSADQYRRYATAIDTSWGAGLDSLLTLEDARRTAISAETTLIGLQRDRVRYWIALYKAVGGGWRIDSSSAPPASATTTSLSGVPQ